ncbi:MAG: 3-keto-disaccharide hydrolase [Candidatus Dormibacteraceae bacterium]
MALPRMLKHISLATMAALAVGAASVRADDKSTPLGPPDAHGFVSLFNGKDLSGWEGLDGYWSVKDGVIDGSETKERSVQTDLILSASKERPEKFINFELRLKWRLVSPDGNSGVQFRSVINNPKTLHAGGYQADIDSGGNYTGSIYDESGIAGGRGTMSNRGEKTIWDAQNQRHASPLAQSGAELKKLLHNTGDWNAIVLVVRGDHFQYQINDHLMTEMIDESPKAVLKGGVIAMQMHAGFTMDIQFNDISIKFLEGNH